MEILIPAEQNTDQYVQYFRTVRIIFLKMRISIVVSTCETHTSFCNLGLTATKMQISIFNKSSMYRRCVVDMSSM